MCVLVHTYSQSCDNLIFLIDRLPDILRYGALLAHLRHTGALLVILFRLLVLYFKTQYMEGSVAPVMC